MNTPQTEPQLERSKHRILCDDQAAAALERADAKELHQIYRNAMERNDKLTLAMSAVVNHYVGEQETPRYQPSESAVESMERVALAAIDLAKAVTTFRDTKTP